MAFTCWPSALLPPPRAPSNQMLAEILATSRIRLHTWRFQEAYLFGLSMRDKGKGKAALRQVQTDGLLEMQPFFITRLLLGGALAYLVVYDLLLCSLP